MRFFSAIGLIGLLLAGCATTAMVDDADAQIRASGARFAEALNNRDWATIESFYAQDAVLMVPNMEAVRGPSAIRRAWESFGPIRPQLALSTDQVVQECDLAYETGTYTLQLNPEGSAAIHDRGKFITVWRRMPGGQWKLVADIFNTSMPAPGM